MLFGKSLKVIDVVEYDPMLRAKLNEPDRKWGVEADFFEGVLLSYSSISNYTRLLAAGRYFRNKRRMIRDLGLDDDPDCAWLFAVIQRERGALRGKFRSILWRRTKRDWRSAWRLLMKPVGVVRYQSQATVASLVAGIRISPDFLPGLRDEQLTLLCERLAPGDVLLCRADDKVTSALLPGFWAHTVLRPRLPVAELRAAMLEAFGHVGKPYDFEFDFNVSRRIVCTELIYRAFHGRGAIRFVLAKRVGRYTLTADDIAAQYLAACAGQRDEPFDLVDLFLKEKWDGAERVSDATRMQRFAALLPKVAAPAV